MRKLQLRTGEFYDSKPRAKASFVSAANLLSSLPSLLSLLLASLPPLMEAPLSPSPPPPPLSPARARPCVLCYLSPVCCPFLRSPLLYLFPLR